MIEVDKIEFSADAIAAGKGEPLNFEILQGSPSDDMSIRKMVLEMFEDRNKFNYFMELKTIGEEGWFDLKIDCLRAQLLIGRHLADYLKELQSQVTRDEWLTAANNTINWMMSNMTPVPAIFVCRLMIGNHQLPFEISRMPAFDAFAKKYRVYILADPEDFT